MNMNSNPNRILYFDITIVCHVCNGTIRIVSEKGRPSGCSRCGIQVKEARVEMFLDFVDPKPIIITRRTEQ